MICVVAGSPGSNPPRQRKQNKYAKKEDSNEVFLKECADNPGQLHGEGHGLGLYVAMKKIRLLRQKNLRLSIKGKPVRTF